MSREIAGRMFSIAPEEVKEDDIRDALSELANIIAGNVKALLPAPSHLSLPTYLGGRDVPDIDCEGSAADAGGATLAVAVHASR